MRLNIFEQIKNVEINYAQEMQRIEQLFSKTDIVLNNFTFNYYSLEQYVNDYLFLKWEHRGTFLNINEMREALNISYKNMFQNNKEIMLNYFEFVWNILKLFKKNVRPENIRKEYFVALVDNIESTLDKINYKVEENKDCAIIIEKDPKAIAVAEIYEDISENIIEYRRFTIQGNIERKKEILATLSKKVEAIESNLKQNQYSYLIDEITSLLNNLDIRHNNIEGKHAHEVVKGMEPKELEEWCDNTYDTILLGLMVNHYLDYKKDIKELNKLLKK